RAGLGGSGLVDDALALGVGDVPGGERAAHDTADERDDLVVHDVATDLDAAVHGGSDATVVGVLHDRKNLLATHVAQLTARLTGDIGGVADQLLLRFPEFGGVVAKTAQFLLPLA